MQGKTSNFRYFTALKTESSTLAPLQAEPKKKPLKNPQELAILYQKILRSQYVSKADLARKVGASRVRVTQILSLLKLDGTIVKYVKSIKYSECNRTPERQLRSLAKINRHKL
jgi:biotin operon repressor